MRLISTCNYNILPPLSPLYQLKVSAHQVYNDAARIENNNGEVDRTLPALTAAASTAASTAARRKNPIDSHTFSESSNQIGAILDVAWNNSAKAAVDTALRDLQWGDEKAMRKVDTNIMSNMCGDAAAIALPRQFTRDGEHAEYLRTVTTCMGSHHPTRYCKTGANLIPAAFHQPRGVITRTIIS